MDSSDIKSPDLYNHRRRRPLIHLFKSPVYEGEEIVEQLSESPGVQWVSALRALHIINQIRSKSFEKDDLDENVSMAPVAMRMRKDYDMLISGDMVGQILLPLQEILLVKVAEDRKSARITPNGIELIQQLPRIIANNKKFAPLAPAKHDCPRKRFLEDTGFYFAESAAAMV